MNYDDLMPRGSTRAEQEAIKRERLAEEKRERQEYLKKRLEDKVTTVEELIVKLLHYPLDMKVVTPDPGCGCCSSDEPVDLLVQESNGTLYLGGDYRMPGE